MSTLTANPKVKSVDDVESSGHFWVLLPYIVTLAAQLPLLLYYFNLLWARPHYGFFPFAILMVVVFAYVRWPKGFAEPFFTRGLSNFLFGVGVVFGVAAALFSFAWFSAVSMVALMTSLFARTKDAEVPGKSLIVLSLPLLIILMPPNNLDARIITGLQLVGSSISSSYLDLFNFKHYSSGTVLEFPGQDYGVEQACSGVQSFFTLLFCTSFLVVSMRRPWHRGLLLLISAGFWAVCLNAIRIMTIPIADIMFGIDLKDGLSHDILGYSAMLIAVLMILSTDQMLEFVFGRTNSGRLDEGVEMGAQIDDDDEEDFSHFRPVSSVFKKVALVASVLVLMLGSLQVIDFVRSMGQPSRVIRAFSTNVLVDIDSNGMPEFIRSTFVSEPVPDDSEPSDLIASSDSGQRPVERKFVWKKVNYNRQDRKSGSDFGLRSDSWTYRSATRLTALASLDQTFPGWHELSICYINRGWKMNPGARKKRNASLVVDGQEDQPWPYIECDLVNPTTGQHALLLFSLCDADGVPFEAPLEWDGVRSLYERVKNRLFHSLRKTFFRGEAYQIQVIVLNSREFGQAGKEEIRSQYLEIRKKMRDSLLKYGSGDESAVADESSLNDENAGIP